MKNNYSVYKHTFPNGKVYIGITKLRPDIRYNSEGRGYWFQSKSMFFAIKKYGWKNVAHDILFENLTQEEAHAKEKELIAFYDSTNKEKGYNISPGGGKLSEETKRKISLCFKGKHLSEETKRKIGVANKGKIRSEETRKKISESRKGKHHSEETKRKMSVTLKGRQCMSEEAKMKISLSRKGKHHSEETKRKMSASHKEELSLELSQNRGTKKVFQYDLNEKFIKEWKSVSSASRELKLNKSSISKVCCGKRKKTGGFIWRFTEEENNQLTDNK